MPVQKPLNVEQEFTVWLGMQIIVKKNVFIGNR